MLNLKIQIALLILFFCNTAIAESTSQTSFGRVIEDDTYSCNCYSSQNVATTLGRLCVSPNVGSPNCNLTWTETLEQFNLRMQRGQRICVGFKEYRAATNYNTPVIIYLYQPTNTDASNIETGTISCNFVSGNNQNRVENSSLIDIIHAPTY